jgi:hypothetical protein
VFREQAVTLFTLSEELCVLTAIHEFHLVLACRFQYCEVTLYKQKITDR